MAINKVNNETEEKNFKFLQNQSTIIRTVFTNKIIFNGVNVIVEKPKVGDVMCVTRYKDTSDTLLGADKQKIIWIDGLSIVPNQLSSEFEPIGICVAINGNKAIVKHKSKHTGDGGAQMRFSTHANETDVHFDASDVEPQCYLNNGFHNNQYYQHDPYEPTIHAGCCRAQFYVQTQVNSSPITSQMTDIFKVPGRSFPVSKTDFINNDYCKILRDNFDTYDEYFDSRMVKIPCGKGTVGKFPSGKYMTYKLAKDELFQAPKWAASKSVNAPNLGIGNWWIPSVGEMAQIMHDITFGTSYWDNENIDNNTDIVNRVLFKLQSFDSNNWYMISANENKWTSSIYSNDGVYIYDLNRGTFNANWSAGKGTYYEAMAITIYEF